MKFLHPEYFWLLLLLLPYIVWYVLRYRKLSVPVLYSSSQAIRHFKTNRYLLLRHALMALRMVVISLVIVALARPQSHSDWQTKNTRGIDILLALDLSSSMLAQDLRPNRLEAAKKVAIEFIGNRPSDRIGVVAFAGESFTQCPLTTDHVVTINLTNQLREELLEDGTAIGMGLATAVARLKDSDNKSKIIILLTDGENNKGNIDPATAADLAAVFGIRVYTIGVGTTGEAPYPVVTPFGTQIQRIPVKIDEKTLREISTKTNGKYFRATNNKRLQEIYDEIDKLEKGELIVRDYSSRQEHFLLFALSALLVFLGEITMRYLVYKGLS